MPKCTSRYRRALVLLATMTVFQVASFIEMSRDMLLVTSLGFAVLEKLYSFTFFMFFKLNQISNNWHVNLISLALSYSYQRKVPQLASPPPPQIQGLHQATWGEEDTVGNLGVLTPYLMRGEPNDQTLTSPEGTTDRLALHCCPLTLLGGTACMIGRCASCEWTAVCITKRLGDSKYTMHGFQTPPMGQAGEQTAMSGLEGDTRFNLKRN